MAEKFVATDAEIEAFRRHTIDGRQTLYEAIQDYYRTIARPKVSVTEIGLAIAEKFRPVLLETVCKEMDWVDGECIAVALEIAKQIGGPLVGGRPFYPEDPDFPNEFKDSDHDPDETTTETPC
jgi:hypothetical protein